MPSAPAPPPLAAHCPLIVVSRLEPARRLLRLLLARMGYACTAVEDGDEALALLAARPSAVLVVDARAPTEEELLFLGLLERRHPDVGRLVLHAGQGRLRGGGREEVRAWQPSAEAGPAPVLPSAEELQHAVEQLLARDTLARLRPPTARA
jgi:DNA-binding NtrC family response regulator